MKKLLMIGDAGVRTGFARVLKGIADGLFATGEYDISVRGINYQDDHGIAYDYDVQPISFQPHDKAGFASLNDHIAETRPDALWVIHDPWTLAGYASLKPADLPSVAYVPVDTPFIRWDYALALPAWSEIAAYTQFGARELCAGVQAALDVIVESTRGGVLDHSKPVQNLTLPIGVKRSPISIRASRLARLQNLENWHVLPHGAEPGLFAPRDKRAARAAFGFDPGWFVVGMVGVNTQRKRMDVAIRAFAEFAATRPNAKLVIYSANGDQDGYDFASLCRFYGVSESVTPLHWQVRNLTDDDLCTLYNCFDVMLNTSSGEGWNLPAMEAAACGIPQVAPDWAAMGELWRDFGLLTPVRDWRHAIDFATAHGEVSATETARRLAELYDGEAIRLLYAGRALDKAAMQLPWSTVAEAMGVLVERAIHEPSHPLSISEALASRRDPVHSVIHPSVWQ